MSALASLKLVTAKRPMQLSPVVQRRNKVLKRIYEQILLATALQEGKQYAPTKLKAVKDELTGETKTVQVPKRIKETWFVTDTGKFCLSLKYGAKVLPLNSKGATAVELANADELVPVLEKLREAVEKGELDTQIEAVAGAVRAKAKK